MPAWALRAVAVLVTGLTMVGSTTYALAHPKNANAPLQPPVAEQPEAVEPEPQPTAAPPFRTLAPTEAPTPTPLPTTPAPSSRATSTGIVVRTTASPTLAPTPRATATLRATPVPQITLAAGVRATQLPKVTFTHRS